MKLRRPTGLNSGLGRCACLPGTKDMGLGRAERRRWHLDVASDLGHDKAGRLRQEPIPQAAQRTVKRVSQRLRLVRIRRYCHHTDTGTAAQRLRLRLRLGAKDQG